MLLMLRYRAWTHGEKVGMCGRVIGSVLYTWGDRHLRMKRRQTGTEESVYLRKLSRHIKYIMLLDSDLNEETLTGLKTWMSWLRVTKWAFLAVQVAVSSLSPVSIHTCLKSNTSTLTLMLHWDLISNSHFKATIRTLIFMWSYLYCTCFSPRLLSGRGLKSHIGSLNHSLISTIDTHLLWSRLVELNGGTQAEYQAHQAETSQVYSTKIKKCAEIKLWNILERTPLAHFSAKFPLCIPSNSASSPNIFSFVMLGHYSHTLSFL